jgi:hypothetical protein
VARPERGSSAAVGLAVGFGAGFVVQMAAALTEGMRSPVGVRFCPACGKAMS